MLGAVDITRRSVRSFAAKPGSRTFPRIVTAAG